MDPLLEEEPDEEPEEPEHPAEPGDGAAPTARSVPSVAMPTRDWEYSSKSLTVTQVADGSSLVKALQEAATDGWELADVIDAGDKRVLLMRRPKRASRESRRVGFAPPNHG